MSLDSKITCPHCHVPFQLTDALSHELEAKFESKIKSQTAAREAEFQKKFRELQAANAEVLKKAELEREELRKKMESDISGRLQQKYLVEQEDLKNQLTEERKRSQEAAQKELEMRKAQRGLEEREKAMAGEKEQLLQQVEIEKGELKKRLEKDLALQFQQKFSVEQEDLKSQLEEERKRAQESQKKELELRKMQRDLETKAQEQEIEMQRKLDEERGRVLEDAQKQADARSSLQLEAKNAQLAALQRALEEAQRKASQGSQQTQGEALELKLEDELSKLFPQDQFEPVPKGVKGADLIQRVYTQGGKIAGTILWEFKNRKNWSDEWVTKLKEDQRELSAEMAAIVTSVMPKEMAQMGEQEQVWITQPLLAKCLAELLRSQILRVHQARAASLIPADQKESLFSYLTGTKFKHSIEGELETVSRLLTELQKEKLYFQKSWNSREQQLNSLLSYKAGLYGDLQGIMGKSLPTIPLFELPEPEGAEG